MARRGGGGGRGDRERRMDADLSFFFRFLTVKRSSFASSHSLFTRSQSGYLKYSAIR